MNYAGKPIRSLQTMLRVIASVDSEEAHIIPDGIYGPQTMQAVSRFQRRHGIPVTGITDQTTWDVTSRPWCSRDLLSPCTSS